MPPENLATLRQTLGNNVVDLEVARPLRRKPPAPSPYPVEALGPIAGAAVRGCAELIQCQPEIAAQSALGVMALAVQALADVELPLSDDGSVYARPTSLYLISVAGSGDRKSTADNLFGGVMKEFEREAQREFESARVSYENERAAYEAARAAAKQNAKGDRDAVLSALDRLGPEPTEPAEPTFTYPDPTLEGLQKHLARARSSVGVFSDEGGQFTGGVGMSRENLLRTAGGFSKFWDGDPVKRLRAGDGQLVLYGRRVSLHLMLQPENARAWFSSSVLRDQGLFSRLLIAAPESLAGTRFYRPADPSARLAVNAFSARIAALLSKPLAYAEGGRELAPPCLTMTDAARGMWRDYADRLEAELGANGAYRPVLGLANKIPEHAARLAAVLSVFEQPEVRQVDAGAMRSGITLASWYLDEALRLAEDGMVSERVLVAEKLLAWLQSAWPRISGGDGRLVSLPDIYQLGPNVIREKSAATEAAEVLVDHGWLSKLDGTHVVRGVKRRGVFAIREQ